MRIFRVITVFLAVAFFFLLGIGFADKEYLSENVVGIRIYADDPQIIEYLYDLLGKLQCTDARQLCRMLCDEKIYAYLSPEKQYFDVNNCVMGHFPYAAYDTIIIDLSERDPIEASYLKLVGSLPKRFGCTQSPFTTNIQEYYVSFLSYLGKAEKFTATKFLDFLS